MSIDSRICDWIFEPISSTSSSRVDQLGDFARAHERVELFEHLLALGRIDVDVGGHEVGQSAGVVEVGRGDAHLVRQHRRQLHDALEQRLQVLDQAFDFHRRRLSFGLRTG